MISHSILLSGKEIYQGLVLRFTFSSHPEPTMSNRYSEVYEKSLVDPEAFWSEAARDVYWHKAYDQILDSSQPPFYKWFKGGMLNTCYNALDIHILNGRSDQIALIYDSPVTNQKLSMSYGELLEEVSHFASGLAELGVAKGDRVLIYMPMVPEAAIAMLACARLGAVHSVVFGGFASPELAKRIDDSEPKVVIFASCGIEVDRIIPYKPLLDGALALSAHKPDHCVLLNRPEEKAELIPGRDHDWRELVAAKSPSECTPVLATDPLYILYTSGTTGTPKGVVRDNGGHLVALKWSLKHVYGMSPGETFWAASDIGWVVGHSYIVYAPLFLGCTTVLYEGKPIGTPDPGAFWRIISEHDVKALFTAPTAFRAIKKEDPQAKYVKRYDLTRFRTLFLAGERADSDTILWAEQALNVPVIDHWWQTETGWPMAANCIGLDPQRIKRGSPTKAVPGYDIRVVHETNGKEVKRGETGSIVVRLPLPPGCLQTLWNNDDGFQKSYLKHFPGYYETADAGFIDEDDYLWVMSRTDDIINIAGHRLSTGSMEEVLARHQDVAECAVIGIADKLKGQLPVGVVVLNDGCQRSHEDVIRELIAKIREEIGPVASFKKAYVVARLPKTRSGKILRGTMRNIADKKSYSIPATIDDAQILDEIRDVFEN